MLNLSAIRSTTPVGRALRWPLRWIPKDMVVPVLQGPMRGQRWIVGAMTHGAWLGSFEPRVQGCLVAALRPGDTMYDIGANVGYYTLLAARRVGPSGRVVAFEPFPPSAATLRRHVALNALHQVEVIEAAVGDVAALARFAAGGRNHTAARLSESGELCVSVVTLDDLVTGAGLPPPALIKIDVEGAAVRVLQGAHEVLRRYRPRILLEVHNGEWEGCAAILSRSGYALHQVDEIHWLCDP